MEFDSDQMYCGAIKRGDIFSVNNDKSNLVIVLQDKILNERLSTLIVVPLTVHKAGRVFKNEVLFTKKETGFGHPGVCMLHKTQLIDRRQLTSKQGEIKAEKLQELYKALDINFGRFRDPK